MGVLNFSSDKKCIRINITFINFPFFCYQLQHETVGGSNQCECQSPGGVNSLGVGFALHSDCHIVRRIEIITETDAFGR